MEISSAAFATPASDEKSVPRDPSVLNVEGVSVRFGPLRAVTDVSFSVASGQLLGLIGPNGAGKTTLLRTICGLQRPATGVVKILGNALKTESIDGFEHVGFTPDTPPMYDNLTVRQFLRFIGQGYGLSPGQTSERTDFWLQKVWLTEKADAKIKGLSRGMRQRIGIARALLPNPQVIILDEPAAGLDPAGRVQFRRLLSDLREQGKALVVSSHILADMEEYCTHIGMMSAGRMIQFGTVHEVSRSTLTAGRARYELRLASVVAHLALVLETIEGISQVTIDQDRLSLEYDSDLGSAAALLATLVQQKVPVASFVRQTSGLEQAYLRSGIGQVD
jgi:ABC-2 type transport system ATP-binding protein